MLKLFDKDFFKLAFQFLLIVLISFTVLMIVGYYQLSKEDSLAPEQVNQNLEES